MKSKWNYLSDDDFLKYLKNLYDLDKNNVKFDYFTIKRKEWNVPSIKAYINRFNLKWSEILKLAGIDVDKDKKVKQPKQYKNKKQIEKNNKNTVAQKDERIKITIEEIKRISKLLNRHPSLKEYDYYNNGGYYASSIDKIFKKSFNQVLSEYAPEYKPKKENISI